MQDNLRIILWTFASVMGIWFLTMTLSQYFFYRNDADPIIRGSVAIKNTDIGNQCGVGTANSDSLVEYKLAQSGKIIYLCPLGWWPVQKRIIAKVLTDNFKKAIPSGYLPRVEVGYPSVVAPTAQDVQPFIPLP